MARKTFISYKYSEARWLRDDIITALGQDATYYKGECSDSPDLTDRKTETIKNVLKKMMYGVQNLQKTVEQHGIRWPRIHWYL